MQVKGAIPAEATLLITFLTLLFLFLFFFVCFFIASWIEFKSKLIAVDAIPKELRIALKLPVQLNFDYKFFLH